LIIRSGARTASLAIMPYKRQGRNNNVETVEVGALGDEHFEQEWADSTHLIVRVRNALVTVNYTQDRAPAKDRQRAARGIAAAAIEHLLAANP
jgi:hypothetical protein